jgi:hypothetical protein
LNGTFEINAFHAVEFANSKHVRITYKRNGLRNEPIYTLTESGKALAEQFVAELETVSKDKKHKRDCWERYLYNYNQSFKTDWQYNLRADGAELDTLVVKADTSIVTVESSYTLAQMKEAVRLASLIEISPVSFE